VNGPLTLRDRACAVRLFFIFLLCCAYFVPRWGTSDWVASSRMALTYALVDHRSVSITPYHTSTEDKAFYQGRYFAPGSPGPSLLGLPVYLVFRAAAHTPALDAWFESGPFTPGMPFSQRYEKWAAAWVIFWAVSVPAALLGAGLYLFLRRLRLAREAALLGSVFYALFSLAFPYSKAFFQHQPAAAALFFAFYLLVMERRDSGRAPVWLAAGAMLGFAVISDYLAVLLLLPLLAAVFLRRLRYPLEKLTALGLGAVPFLLVFAGYNLLAFDRLLPLGYRYHVIHTELHRQGLMGLGLPSLDALFGVTFSPARGLFLLSPWLLLALPGFLQMLRQRGLPRRLAPWLALAAVLSLLYNAGYPLWTGGSGVGPRLLAAGLPFLAILAAFGLPPLLRSRAGLAAVILLGAVSALSVWAQTLGGQYYPATPLDQPLSSPLFTTALPALLRGDVAENFGSLLGLPGLLSLAPLAGLLLLVAVLPFEALLRLPRAVRRLMRDAHRPPPQHPPAGGAAL
jgi:hypothetical protein